MDYIKEIDRILSFIKDLVNKSKAKGIVIGLSGGIDSALTATLCTKAVGKEKMLALIMPCHSNPEDIEDAKLVANHLNIQYKIISLDIIIEAYQTGKSFFIIRNIAITPMNILSASGSNIFPATEIWLNLLAKYPSK